MCWAVGGGERVLRGCGGAKNELKKKINRDAEGAQVKERSVVPDMPRSVENGPPRSAAHGCCSLRSLTVVTSVGRVTQ